MGNLKVLLDPKTIAVIGATEREGTYGRTVTENLLASKGRKIFPVNPKRREVFGLPCYKKLSEIGEHVDLAVIATPFETTPRLVEECGKAGVDGVIVLSFRSDELKNGKVEEPLRELAREYQIKVIGPNCLGIIRPPTGLNASIFNGMPDKGGVAFLTQTVGMSRAFLDWGVAAGIGFSAFVSLGSMVDVDFGELIDILGEDIHTRSIIIYMEEKIGNVKRFVSAAKGFARNKPIIILKPRREEKPEEETLTYASQMIQKDKIYDAVFKRLGLLRVREARDLFNLATVLQSRRLPSGPRLLVITNAFGAGLMALNALREEGGEAAQVSEETLSKLKEKIGPFVGGRNPIDLSLDADERAFLTAVEICLREKNADGILVLHTPQGMTETEEFAKGMSELAKRSPKPVIVCLFGGKDKERRDILVKGNVPTYDTPEEAVRTYLYMHKYERNLRSLYETPRELSLEETPPNNNLRVFVRRMLKEGLCVLTDADSQRFLECYGIPVLRSQLATTVEEAVSIAAEMGYPLVMKISSPDTIHRADFGGVITGINSAEEVRAAYEKLIRRTKEVHPNARIRGVAMQRMLEKIDYEVVLGIKKDEEFGSIILFGMGGVGLRIFKDFSLGLPPLNQTLARRLMEDTLLYRMLHGYGEKPPANLEELESIIVSFSNLVVHFPEIREMDINPIAISDGKTFALDARIVISKEPSNPHLVITPYPTRYILQATLKDGKRVMLRPIRPEDEPLEKEMLSGLSDETLRGRFFTVIKDIGHDMLVKFCNIDYDREIAIVAEITEGERRRIIGIGRLILDPDLEKGECAVVVHDEFQRRGLGLRLLDMLIGIGEEKNLKEVYGYVQSSNNRMLNLAKKVGFVIEALPDNVCMIRVELR